MGRGWELFLINRAGLGWGRPVSNPPVAIPTPTMETPFDQDKSPSN